MNTILKRLDYIKENIHLLDEDALWDTAKAITETKVRDFIGFYPGESRFFGRHLFNYKESFMYNKQRFDEWLKKNYHGDKELFLGYANNNALFWHYWFRISGDHYTISQIEYSVSNLFYFLRYIILGKLDKDYTEAMEISEPFKSAGYTMKGIKIGEQFLDVKVFKNGRLDIKGLTPKQTSEINAMIVGKRTSHVNPNYNGEWGNNN